MTEPSPQSKRRRARKPDGKFKGDNPTTPGLNEAWESTEIIDAIGEKSIDYSVKQKVDGTSTDSAGKYGKAKKVTKPTFGKVYTVNN